MMPATSCVQRGWARWLEGDAGERPLQDKRGTLVRILVPAAYSAGSKLYFLLEGGHFCGEVAVFLQT